ncbi:AAA family ATPase [Pseudomonas jessenii]|uniref:AAA family ATPase n=1 Tax=Pseudomonas jessenii TaxID=77298 RepID=UPI0030C1A3D7
MSSARAEYQRFLAGLGARGVSEDTCRLANVVLNNFEFLAEVGATRRARSLRLAPIAIQHLETTLANFPDLHPLAGEEQLIGRIHELRVGPFRGFMSPEVFDLSQSITLVYGANGTGKSSFCEALEVALLGSISEAQVKRINPRTYCDNARLGRHSLPVLTATREGQETVPLQPNEEAYRFCFIEKNRLDDFARIASRTPSDQRQLIATLFGVDQFSDFVRGFNPSLDENLDLAGRQAQQLAVLRLGLTSAEQTIHESEEKTAQFALIEASIAERARPGSTYQEMCDWLLGNPEQLGRLALLQASLEAPQPVVYGISRLNLANLLGQVTRAENSSRACIEELAHRAGEVSYKQLYESVLQLSDSLPGECPACGTNLLSVVQDPYIRAQQGLTQLAELAELQDRSETEQETLSEALRSLYAAIANALSAIGAVLPDSPQSAALPSLPPTAQGSWLADWLANDQAAWQSLLEMCAQVELCDQQSLFHLSQRNAMSEERQQLDAFKTEIERANAVRSTHEEQLLAATNTVAQFDEANRDLIVAIEAEAPVVEMHHRIKRAYDELTAALREYLEGLPAQLLQGLGQSARDLYNSFNREDPPGDLLHSLWLPVAENGKIELEFASEPGVRYDALLILSEGHIKCLGLAILVAKNLAQECPFVIFDDVVNAIDDEHRDGIWRTFFESGLLDTKQVVLTSHAEEFLLRIQQELGAERAQLIRRYKFLPHAGEHHLRVDTDPATKNYVLLAQEALAQEEKRDALRHSRPAIESISDRLWVWLGRQGDGRLELKLNGPNSPWELNNKCLKLRQALRRLANPPEGMQIVLGALDSLLGRDGSIEWGYLNSGTHDSRRDGEFDRAAVRTIVASVTALDQGLSVLLRRQ